jgi:hypothetical protein
VLEQLLHLRLQLLHPTLQALNACILFAHSLLLMFVDSALLCYNLLLIQQLLLLQCNQCALLGQLLCQAAQGFPLAAGLLFRTLLQQLQPNIRGGPVLQGLRHTHGTLQR